MITGLLDRLHLLQFRLIDRTRKPSSMLESTRWLFGALALLSGLLILPAYFADGLWPAGLTAGIILAATTFIVYAKRRVPTAIVITDVPALLVLALAGPVPSTIFAYLFPLLWFRSLYGTSRQAFVRCSAYALVVVACAPLWSYVPGHIGGTEIGPLATSLPTMFVTVVVSRHLVQISQAREQAARRDAAHVRLGSDLLGVKDTAAVAQAAWLAITTICAATPGLRVLKVVTDGDGFRAAGSTEGFAAVPDRVSTAVQAVQGGIASSSAERARGTAELDAAVGQVCTWVAVALPAALDHPPGWLLLGSPEVIAAEAVASMHSLVNQLTLAMRTTAAHQELTVQATLDGLTGLANRASFYAAAAAALARESGGDTAVLFVDLDDFKDVNDVLGHAAGDQLLREVAARLRLATRPIDLCARLGGDEFAVLLVDTSGSTAIDVARRVVQAVAAPAHLSAGVANVGASVGVATAAAATQLDELMHRADVAMYAAKAQGKGRTQLFEPGLLQVDASQLAYERQLAAAAGNGELVVHYQPILSLANGSCSAVEALVRWQHPDRGLLYPSEFVELAERTGAIATIGAYVLRRACEDAATWRVAHPGAPFAVHVNVSALQLDDDAFFGRVTDCLATFAIPAAELVLEITETVTMSSSVTIERLNALAAIGVTIAIDDFGTGYSALTTLRTLPVQIVKIDKSFVAGSTVNDDDRAVTEAVVTMATQMGMQTVAEGVERPDQESFLTSIGATSAQGFLYLRPSTAEEFGSWLATNRAAVSLEPAGSVVLSFPARRAR